MIESPGSALALRIPDLIKAWRARAKKSSGSILSTGSGSPLSPGELNSVASSLLRLQRGLTGERSLAGEAYMEDRGLLGAYLLYYWPVSYIQTAMALAELRSIHGKIHSVLDVGSGPGPASAALLDHGASSLTLVDSGKKALSLATHLLGVENGTSSPRVSTICADIRETNAIPQGLFDVIVLSHSLNELWFGDPEGGAKRLSFIDGLLSRLSDEGTLLIVEPALLSTSRETLELRDSLLAAHPELAVSGPCPGSCPCPAISAGPNRSCHSEYPWKVPDPVASLAVAAGLDRSSVKATWLAFVKSSRRYREESSPESDPIALSGRIISDPMLNKAGRIRYILCTGERLETISAAGSDPEARNTGFMALGRGDTVRFTGLETRGPAAYGFRPGSKLVLVSARPSP